MTPTLAREAALSFEHETHVLDNGLTVVLARDGVAPVLSTQVMYRVGSRHEAPGEHGFAHLFEHLFFEGSAHVAPGELFRLVQETGGSANGSTWLDCTNYYGTVPAPELETVLWLESDRMGFLYPAITADALEIQRSVVAAEWRQSHGEAPYGLAMEALLGAAFPGGHPYGHMPLDSRGLLEQATVTGVRDFYHRWYGPNNAVLVLCGDFAPRHALERVEHWFGAIAPREVPPASALPDVGPPAGRRVRLADRVREGRVYRLYDCPPFPHPDYEAADVLSFLLAQGSSARLWDALVRRRGLAVEVSSFTWPTEAAGTFFVVATARPGVSARALEAALDEEIGELLAHPAPEDEVEGVLNHARLSLICQLNALVRRADAFAHAATLRRDAGYVNRAWDRYGSVGPETLERIAREVLAPGPRAVVEVVPGEARAVLESS